MMVQFLRAAAIAVIAAMALPALARADGAQPDATLDGHKAAVASVTFSPDGKRLASADDDGHLKVWDVATHACLSDVDGVAGEGKPVRFSPDGKRIVCLTNGPAVQQLDAATGKPTAQVAVANLPGGPTALDLSPDGKQVAIGGRGTLRVYELATGAAVADYEVHKEYGITAVAFSPDGKRVATASTDHTSLVVDVATGKLAGPFDLHLNGVAVLFARDGGGLLTYAADGVVRSFDVAGGGDGRAVSDRVSVRTMALSADGKTLVIGGPGRGPVLVSVADGKVTDGAYDSPNFVYAAAVSPDGQWLAGGANQGSVYLWKVAR